MTPGDLACPDIEIGLRRPVQGHCAGVPPLCVSYFTFPFAGFDNRAASLAALAANGGVGYTRPSTERREQSMRIFRDGAKFFRGWALAGVIVAAGIVIVGTSVPAAAQTARKTMTTPSGLQITDIKVGTGATPKPGQICVMHYTGWLYENGQKGKKFDSSVDRNEPFEFPIGKHQVIAGWDEGVATMKVGGKRTLIIPPALGYGARGAGGVIPPNATLMFDVELLGVKG
jgi:peptidylprolyl isomerase